MSTATDIFNSIINDDNIELSEHIATALYNRSVEKLESMREYVGKSLFQEDGMNNGNIIKKPNQTGSTSQPTTTNQTGSTSQTSSTSQPTTTNQIGSTSQPTTTNQTTTPNQTGSTSQTSSTSQPTTTSQTTTKKNNY